MTKGLRCPNCDTTINKKAVLDWLLNKKTQYLRCNNAFCNTRWNRNVLEKHKAEFLGEPEPVKVSVPAPKPKVEEVVVKKTTKKAPTRSSVTRKSETWLDRIRSVARQVAKVKGVVSVDDLRTWADVHCMQPSSTSAWGSVFQGDTWKKVSQKNSTYSKSRSRRVTVWALKAPEMATV